MLGEPWRVCRSDAFRPGAANASAKADSFESYLRSQFLDCFPASNSKVATKSRSPSLTTPWPRPTGYRPAGNASPRRPGGASLAVMAQAADLGELHDRAGGGWLCGARDRRVLILQTMLY